MPIDLLEHQSKLRDLARIHPRYGVFWKPGTGKTIGTLAIHKDQPARTLVVATRAIVETAWMKDAELMDVPAVNAMGTRARRREALSRRSNEFVCTNYDQFRIERRFIAECGFDRIIFDESSKLKNPKSKTTQAAFDVGHRARSCYLLTGTPAPNAPIEIWSQLHLIDRKASGGTFWRFAHHFFNPVKEYVYIPDGRGGRKKQAVITGWEFKDQKAEKAFNAHVSKYAWALRKEDCVDLPDSTSAIIKVELSRDERMIYEEIREDATVTLARDPSRPMSADNFDIQALRSQGIPMKLRQVPGGTLITRDGIRDIGNSKWNALSDWLDELGSEKVVIWSEFAAEIAMLKRRLEARGDAVEVIAGSSKKSVGESVDSFVKGRANRIICHPQSAGHGTNTLQHVAKYAVFYSMSYSSELHEQARDRLHRTGQKWPVTNVYLIAENTVDEAIYATVELKQELQAELLKELTRNRR